MKNIVFIITLFSAITLAQNKKSNWKEENLYGKVKSVREISYQAVKKNGTLEKGAVCDIECHNFLLYFNEKGFFTEKINYNTDGSLNRKIIYEYDEKDNKIAQNVYNSEEKLMSKWKYQYDAKGNKTQEQLYEEGIMEMKEELLCDKKNNLIEVKSYFGEGNTLPIKDVFFYDKKGNKTKKISYDNKDTSRFEYTFKYDKKGKLIEENIYNFQGILGIVKTYQYEKNRKRIERIKYKVDKSIYKREIEEYDKNDNLTEESEYNDKGELIEKVSIQYDDKGNQIKHDWFYPEINIDRKRTYTYEYDPHGNWIKCIVYVNNLPETITERIIEYY